MPRWLKPCAVRQMSLTEAAWLAGFFDGEGSLCHFMGGRDKRHPTWILTISNTHLGSLEQCVKFSGAGSLNAKSMKARPAHHKPQHQWRVVRQRDIAEVCRQMLPFLVIKRAAAESYLMSWIDIEE